RRVEIGRGIPFSYGDDVVSLIGSRCTEVESGGRMIDAILTNSVLPSISRELLQRSMDGRPATRVHLQVVDGDFDYAFDGTAA
ncbi:MAG TPA: hypothetical protein VMU33_19190, partial [Burkholderiaceae bacterium]|nr:hypothetical protein [Burkholderiaceae bacterium]